MPQSGHCNPVFKEALREGLSVSEGMASEESMPSEVRTVMMGVWGCHGESLWGVSPSF